MTATCRPADGLVDRVVPAHVLPDHQQVPVGVGDRGRVQPTGDGKDLLLGAQPVGQHEQHVRTQYQRVIGHRVPATHPDPVDAGPPAQPTGAAGVEGAFDTDVRRRDGRGESDIEHVVGLAATSLALRGLPLGGLASAGGAADDITPCTGTVTHRCDIRPAADDPLADEKTEGQVDVVSGRAHGDGQRPAAHPQLQRLLTGQAVGPRPSLTVS